MIKVTYLGHSGFLAELEDVCLLFDYYKGELPELDPDKKMAVFVSHSHYDHYRKDIFRLRDRFGQIRFILSDDVPAAEEEDVIFVGQMSAEKFWDLILRHSVPMMKGWLFL